MPRTPGEKVQRSEVMSLGEAERLRLLSDELQRVSTIVDTKQLTQVPRALSELREMCEWLTPQHATTLRMVLEDLAHRLQVWRNNWPRLQNDFGFRIAVARELRLWAQQLSASIVKRKAPPRR